MLENLREWHLPTDDVEERGIRIGIANGLPVILDPRNTFIRVFGEGDDGPYNQVVHFLPGFERGPLVWPLNQENMEDIKERLLNEGYPVYHSSEPDEHVLLWFRQILEMQRQQDTEP